jgi:hypothetical protein
MERDFMAGCSWTQRKTVCAPLVLEEDGSTRVESKGKESKMIELTDEQAQALETHEPGPLQVLNPRTQETFVVIRQVDLINWLHNGGSLPNAKEMLAFPRLSALTAQLRQWALHQYTEEEVVAGLREARENPGPELGDLIQEMEQGLHCHEHRTSP